MEGFKTTDLGIFLTHVFVTILEAVWLAPKGTARMHSNLTSGARGLHKGGSQGLFTPMLFFKAVKPAAQAAAPAAASAGSSDAAAALPAAVAKSPAARASSRSRGIGASKAR